jgi:N-acetylmuramoyl-L-alanine amidase
MLYRLHIALVFVAPVLLLAGLYAIGHALGVRAPLLGRSYVIRIELPDPDAGVGLPPIVGPQDPGRPLVVIDAGHGGHDPGASGATALGEMKEKTLALGLARGPARPARARRRGAGRADP